MKQKTKLSEPQMQIYTIAKLNPGITQAAALAEVEKQGLRLLTNKEADKILMDDGLRKKYYDYWPFWTGTHLEYSGDKCKVTENGKTVELTMPLKNGWYEQEPQFVLPFGAPSNSDNPDARYLWRRDSYTGLLARGYGFVNYLRDVVACDDGYRLGVLAVKKSSKGGKQ
ncbi:MAG: hypothetical protein EHM12_10930 [Dehalococcoidia bacterium]|nr:MAG: hypothetical protein EHM12_10930 [Dehalococcoidia bacterium]